MFFLYPKELVAPICTDHITEDERTRKWSRLKHCYDVNAFNIALFDALLLLLSFMMSIAWPDSRYQQFEFFIRWPTGVRMLMLLRTVFNRQLPILRMLGAGRFYKMPRAFIDCKPLIVWALLGIADYFLVRLATFFISIFYFTFLERMWSFRTTICLLVDLLYIWEFPLSVTMVYTLGIRRNVEKTFGLEKKSSSASATVTTTTTTPKKRKHQQTTK